MFAGTFTSASTPRVPPSRPAHCAATTRACCCGTNGTLLTTHRSARHYGVPIAMEQFWSLRGATHRIGVWHPATRYGRKVPDYFTFCKMASQVYSSPFSAASPSSPRLALASTPSRTSSYHPPVSLWEVPPTVTHQLYERRPDSRHRRLASSTASSWQMLLSVGGVGTG